MIRQSRHYVPMAMIPRDPLEQGRTATPLELFFDLCFVVAIAQAAAQLHHAVVEHHVAAGVGGFLMVFFAIWWGWMNFTWFASAYDCDDTWYRLAVFVQVAGVLIIAAAIPAAMNERDFVGVAIGYVVMRLSMVSLWVRAGLADPERRATCFRYAVGIGIMQVGWLLWLLLPDALQLPGFLLLILGELAVPILGERPGATPWHPHHIAERYGLLTIIVLGESILGISVAFQSGLGDELRGDLVAAGIAGVVIVCSMWWLYFNKPSTEVIAGVRTRYDAGGGQVGGFLWGYGHYFIFASAAAVGAGLAAAVDLSGSPDATDELGVVIPLALYVVLVSFLSERGTLASRVGISLVGAAVLISGGALQWPLAVLSVVVPAILVAIAALDRLQASGRAQSAQGVSR